MAQKQYEMLFELNAKLNGQFSSAFKSAQGELQQFRSAYRELAQTTNDVSGYQKQQQAAENTKGKLALLQQQYDNIQRELEETGGSSSELENKLLSKQAQIDKTTKAYQDQIARLGEYRQKLEAAGVDTTKLDEESKRLQGELEQLKKGFAESGEKAEQFGERGKDAAVSVGDALAAAGIAAALKKIYDAASECVDAYAEFEAAMSSVEAIANANGQELASLTEEARQLGATTVYTAQQVSEGMGYMAMAGWRTNDMLAGMDSVLSLAAASGEDLGTVSDIVTDSLTAFGLTAKDTARFSDVLAAAATNANTNVGLMGETFKYAGPVAGALGYSIEDVAVATGLMANSGIKASLAGTTLRNTFNGLLSGVTLTSDAFGEYEVNVVNADGTMKDLRSTVDELRAHFEQMSEAERVQNALNIAGQRGYAGLLAILNSTEEEYDKLAGAIDNSTGAAQRMAAIKLDNLQGQMTLAKSAWEGLRIEVGEQFAPELSGVYELFASIAGELTEFVRENPRVVKALGALTLGAGAFVAVLAAYTVGAKLAAAAQTALNAAQASNGFVALASAIAAATALLITYALTTDSTTGAVQEYERAVQDLQKTRDEEIYSTEATATVAQHYIERLKELEAAGLETEEQQREYHNVLTLLAEKVPELSELIDLETDSVKGGTAALEAHTKAIKDNARAQAYEQYLTDVYRQQADAMIAAEEASLRLTEAQQKREMDEAAWQDVVDQMWEMEEAAKAAAKAMYGEDWEQIGWSGFLDLGYDELKQKEEELHDVLQDSRFAEADAQATYDDLAQAVENVTVEVENAEAAYAGVTTQTQEHTEATRELAEATEAYSSMADVIGAYHGQIQDLTEAYTEAYAAALESIGGQYKLWDDVAEVSAKSVDEVIGSIEKQTEYWNAYNENIQTLLGYSGEIEGLSEMVATFGDGSKDSVDMIAGMAQAAKSGDPSKIKAMVDAWQENKKAMDEAAQSLGLLNSGLGEKTDEIAQEIAAAVQSMDKSTESYAAARATIRAFIDGANDLLPDVQEAYRQIGDAARNALTPRNAGRGAVSLPLQEGYASGTDNAAPGWHLVGEHGPEIEYFFGGEHVLDAAKTQRVMQAAERAPAGDSVQITFAPVYNLSGVTDAAELRETLAAHDEELKRQIVELLEERNEDRVRRAYL